MLRYDLAGRQTVHLEPRCTVRRSTEQTEQREKKVVFRSDRNLDALCCQQFVKFDGMTFFGGSKGVESHLLPDSYNSSTILQTCKKKKDFPKQNDCWSYLSSTGPQNIRATGGVKD